MEITNRKEVFEKFETIKGFIGNYQLPFFDEEFDSRSDEEFDALQFASNINVKGFDLLVNSNCINDHSKNLSIKLKELSQQLEIKEFVILSHLKIDFFGNLNHNYPKVLDIYERLTRYFPKQSFKEAIKLKVDEIDEFVEIFFWLERFDPSIPEYIFWFDTKEQYCFFLCKYGNIHLIDFIQNGTVTESRLEDFGFIINDFDQFAENTIEGREINF